MPSSNLHFGHYFVMYTWKGIDLPSAVLVWQQTNPCRPVLLLPVSVTEGRTGEVYIGSEWKNRPADNVKTGAQSLAAP